MILIVVVLCFGVPILFLRLYREKIRKLKKGKVNSLIMDNSYLFLLFCKVFFKIVFTQTYFLYGSDILYLTRCDVMYLIIAVAIVARWAMWRLVLCFVFFCLWIHLMSLFYTESYCKITFCSIILYNIYYPIKLTIAK